MALNYVRKEAVRQPALLGAKVVRNGGTSERRHRGSAIGPGAGEHAKEVLARCHGRLGHLGHGAARGVTHAPRKPGLQLLCRNVALAGGSLAHALHQQSGDALRKRAAG